MLQIDQLFKMKRESIDEPDVYLGAKLFKVTMQNEVECGVLSPRKYVQGEV